MHTLSNLFDEGRRREIQGAIAQGKTIVFKRQKPAIDKFETEKAAFAGAQGTMGGYASKWDSTGDSLRQWD